jgi:hypothetical protein
LWQDVLRRRKVKHPHYMMVQPKDNKCRHQNVTTAAVPRARHFGGIGHNCAINRNRNSFFCLLEDKENIA